MGKIGKVIALNISKEKGKNDLDIAEVFCKVNYGIVNDYHAGPGDKQISLQCDESITKLQQTRKGLNLDSKGLCEAKFIENIRTEGVNLYDLPIGAKIKIGETIQEISKVGKKCFASEGCKLAKLIGSCNMTKEVIFTKVIKEGYIRKNDIIELL